MRTLIRSSSRLHLYLPPSYAFLYEREQAWEGEQADARQPVDDGALEGSSILQLLETLAMHGVLTPLAVVHARLVSAGIRAYPMSDAIFPASLVLSHIRPNKRTKTVVEPILEFSMVVCAIRPATIRTLMSAYDNSKTF